MKNLGVVPMAWGPLAEGGHGIWTHPTLEAIGKKHGKTNAQVALRFNTQRGVVVIPKTAHRTRMAENLSIFDFTLDQEDLSAIEALDTGHTEIIDHLNIDTVTFLNQYRIHD